MFEITVEHLGSDFVRLNEGCVYGRVREVHRAFVATSSTLSVPRRFTFCTKECSVSSQFRRLPHLRRMN